MARRDGGAVSETVERVADDLMWEREFALAFGQDQVDLLMAAATEHKNGVHDDPKGNPFRWSVLICIGFECFSRPKFREYHGFTMEHDAAKQWFVDRSALHDYHGDVDYLSLMAGSYGEWMGQKQEA